MSNAKEPYKKVHCPICKVEMVYEKLNEEEGTYLLMACPACGLSTFPRLSYYESEADWNEVVEDAEKLISKFPPIMRVEVGDKLIYYDGLYERQGGIVRRIDRFSMKILMESGDYPTSDRIIKWPWEIEQDTEN